MFTEQVAGGGNACDWEYSPAWRLPPIPITIDLNYNCSLCTLVCPVPPLPTQSVHAIASRHSPPHPLPAPLSSLTLPHGTNITSAPV